MKGTSEQPLKAFSTFGITIEPAGGSPGPTGDKVLGGGL
jgi:anti-sigma-K factor RskA